MSQQRLWCFWTASAAARGDLNSRKRRAQELPQKQSHILSLLILLSEILPAEQALGVQPSARQASQSTELPKERTQEYKNAANFDRQVDMLAMRNIAPLCIYLSQTESSKPVRKSQCRSRAGIRGTCTCMRGTSLHDLPTDCTSPLHWKSL